MRVVEGGVEGGCAAAGAAGGMCAAEREYWRMVAERERRYGARVRRLGTESRIRSSVAYQQYRASTQHHTQGGRQLQLRCIPRFAELGLTRYPLLVQLDFAALFLGTIALFVPYWAVVVSEQQTLAAFGLWSYCESDVNYCVSVHDNIIPSRDIPAWYVLCQYNFAIGQFMTAVTIAFLTSNTRLDDVVMTPTVSMATQCFSVIAGLEKFVSVYTFVAYLEQADFLYTWDSALELNWVFYCAGASLVFDALVALTLFLNEEVSLASRRAPQHAGAEQEATPLQQGGAHTGLDTQPLLEGEACHYTTELRPC